MKNRIKLISFIIIAGLMLVLMSRQPATGAEASQSRGVAKENSDQQRRN